MIISKNEMDAMHSIQIDIFKSVIGVCEALGLRYFLVHGSLLGAVRTGYFIPLDDDIDIAMPRADYERLITEGPHIINNRYFIQSNKTDKNYPLEFAKVRDSETTYIAGPCRKIEMHHGVFIDVFPIDFVESNIFLRKVLTLTKKVLNVRISCALYSEKETPKRKVLHALSKVLIPSWTRAVELNEKMNKRLNEGEYVKLTGGKPAEESIPAEWFLASSCAEFEEIPCAIPAKWEEYLSQIYGDYTKRTLLENKEHDENGVEINAQILDLTKSYKAYRGNF